MDSSKLASGDNSNSTSPRHDRMNLHNINSEVVEIPESCANKITPQLIDEKEIKMKERIAQCKNMIESLKLQLNEEKEKIKNEKKLPEPESPLSMPGHYKTSNVKMNVEDYGNCSMYSASIDSKLLCDDNLIEYEKQLQKYQNTLNMAQNEKKNAIRKQMLAKAFKLKLLEVENQCNIELLRVKQSLQCLEPLQIIADKWKTNTEYNNIYDINTFELIPNFPELNANSGSDIINFKDEHNLNIVIDAGENIAKDESTTSE